MGGCESKLYELERIFKSEESEFKGRELQRSREARDRLFASVGTR
jgi:hypothetical protein